MRLSFLTVSAISASARALTTTICESYLETTTFTAYQTFTQSGAYILGADGQIVLTVGALVTGSQSKGPGGSPGVTSNGPLISNTKTATATDSSGLLYLTSTAIPSVMNASPGSSTDIFTGIAASSSFRNVGVIGPTTVITASSGTQLILTTGGITTTITGISIDTTCTATPTSTVICNTRPAGVSTMFIPGCYLSTGVGYAPSCTLGPDGNPVYAQGPISGSMTTIANGGAAGSLTTTVFTPPTVNPATDTALSASIPSQSTLLSSSTVMVTFQGPSTGVQPITSTGTPSSSSSGSPASTSSLQSEPPITLSTSLLSTPLTTSTTSTILRTTSTATNIPVITLVGTTSSTTSTTRAVIPISSLTTSSASPIITDQAYIDTVLRHHNIHRLNHTSPYMIWNASQAATAQKIAQTCLYAHNTQIDCASGGGCYGQNIAAGYAPTQMGFLVSDGFYNSEEPFYTHYGTEPSLQTVQTEIHQWGHFSQIVWLASTSVGCYTQDCSALANSTTGSSGLGNIPASANIRPYFTVCNYYPPGNYIGSFQSNVLAPRNPALPSVHAGYQCPTDQNCANANTVPNSALTINPNGTINLPLVGIGVGVTINANVAGGTGTVLKRRRRRRSSKNEYVVGETKS